MRPHLPTRAGLKEMINPVYLPAYHLFGCAGQTLAVCLVGGLLGGYDAALVTAAYLALGVYGRVPFGLPLLQVRRRID